MKLPFLQVAGVALVLLAGCTTSPARSTPSIEVAPPAKPNPSANDIRYRISQSPPEQGVEGDLVGVVAERAGKTFIVVPPSPGACLSVIVERDLDGDGLTDALIENARSCGGNGLPNEYSFVAGTLGDRFEQQPLADQWSAPELVTWQGRPSFVLVTNNEGYNLDRAQETTRRFVFERGGVVLAEDKQAVEQQALADLRSEQFEGDEDGEQVLDFDLDGDGKLDRIVGSLWERWGRFYWSVKFADGRSSKRSEDACKRLGVLTERTNGHHDLVCDFDTRFSWDGQNYVEVERTP